MEKRYIILGIVLLVAVIVYFLVYQSQGLFRIYRAEAKNGIRRTSAIEESILTQKDIGHLPQTIQKYLNYVGAVGKPKIYNMKVTAGGEMKMDLKKGWIKVNFEQYNFFDNHLTRMFYIKARMFGIPVLGLHAYTDERASMLIKGAGLITVVNAHGREARISDTTTLLNDMCFFAPATLIDKRIQWEDIDPLTVKATFTNLGTTVSALIYFNEKGEMINFSSEDRYFTPTSGTNRKARWSTPIKDYKEMDGRKIPTYGEAVWNFPEGDFCYAKFNDIKEVKYNVKE